MTEPKLDRLVQAALDDAYAYRMLGELCDTVGERLSASPGMARAVAWSQQAMREAGFDSVWTEPVTVPAWTRGREWGRCLSPVAFDLDLCALGLSEGTGPGDLEAEVLAVADYAELAARAGEAAGRIVLFDPPWEGYGRTVDYRVHGASTAARCGALACLVRSMTDASLGTPHTGMMEYDEDAPRIPVAALSLEDAARLHRMCRLGLQPRVRLHLEARNLGPGECANVIGEIRGTELPGQIVLAGAHLDSWDVGPGAHDDGAGSVFVLAAGRLLLQQDLRPRRTVRIVHYTGEEQGGYGGRAYLETHRGELDRHVFAVESDAGAFAPRGFTVDADSVWIDLVGRLAAPLQRLAPGGWSVEAGEGGVDIGPLVRAGVPGAGHRVEGQGYFALHHSKADTYDKVDPRDTARNVAALAGLIHAVADHPGPLPPPSAAAADQEP